MTKQIKLGDKFSGTYYGVAFTGRLTSVSSGKLGGFYGFELDAPITLYGTERTGIGMHGDEVRANCTKIADGPELSWDQVSSFQGHTMLRGRR